MIHLSAMTAGITTEKDPLGGGRTGAILSGSGLEGFIMSSPQTENGYTKIANELLEALVKIELPSTQFRMVFAIMRKTYGYHKKEDGISISQFVEMLGMSRRTIIYNLQDLEAKGVVVICRTRDGQKNNVNIIKFNKDYDTWTVNVSAPQVQRKRESVRRISQLGSGVVQNRGGSAQLNTSAHSMHHGVVHSSVKSSAHSVHPQKKHNKRNITKEICEHSSQDVVDVINAFNLVNPSYGKWYENKTQREAIKRLITTQTLNKLLKVIQLLTKTNKLPYFPTITTPLQLEDKWAQLESALSKKKNELQDKKPKIIIS
jgi:phage replication O-like protein O